MEHERTVIAGARRILLGGTLEDKLGPLEAPDEPDDLSVDTPELPGRPPELTPRPRGGFAAFPDPRHLSADRDRGLVLHYFANHELLAIELMALALLKFRDAPAGFRASILRTLGEEQDHLARYVNRMGALGVRIGDAPVNAHFWTVAAGMRTPAQYAAWMGLVFEQANLDFAVHWRDAFTDAGDADSAALMQRVLDDEIRHVATGAAWLRRLEPGDLWTKWRGLLVPPMTPGHARGPILDEAARRRAGLDEDFIRHLKVDGGTRGREPIIWCINASCEIEIGLPEAAPLPKIAREIDDDLAPLATALAAEGDVVLGVEPPLAHRERLLEAGFPRVSFERADEPRGPGRALRCWGPTPRRLHHLRGWREVVREWPAPSTGVSKSTAAQWRRDLGTSNPLEDLDQILSETLIYSNREAVLVHLRRHDPSNTRAWLARRDHASSGRGHLRVEAGASADDRAARLAEWLQAGGGVVEPWRARVLDLSVQLDVGETPTRGEVQVVRFLTDPAGRYRGHVVGRPFADLPPDVLTRLFSGGAVRALEGVGRAVAARLRAEGFRGRAGVDAMLYRDDAGELRLHPLLEVNARHTMGHVALGAARRVAPGHTGLMIQVNRGDVRGIGGFPALAHAVNASPLAFAGNARLTGGVLALTPPEHARHIAVLLSVHRDLDGARHQLDALLSGQEATTASP